jgi:glutaredoxin
MDDSVEFVPPARARLGSVALFFGVAVLVLCSIEAMSERGLPRMPRSWHTNQLMWWMLGGVAVLAGCRLLMPQLDDGSTSWRPSRSGIRFRQLQLYSREDCPLCDDAMATLEQHRRWLPRVVVIDVDTDARLREKYGDCVPVVACDGKVRFKGRVPVALLRRLIEGTPPV